MAKSKKLSETIAKIKKLSFDIHLSDDELNTEKPDISKRASGYPPDGQATGSFSATVVDQNGKPVQGATVQFGVTFVRPVGNWRSAKGMRALYGSNGAKAERLVNQGVIRVLGTLSGTSATTGSNGVASVTYRTSHIGSDHTQSQQAQEKITATLSNGATKSTVVNIGWTGLTSISTTSGGLRIVGATGKHVHPELDKFLKSLGKAVKDAQWPHPVTVTAASLRWGGQYPPHFTHKHGLTLDIRPMSTDGQPTWAKKDGSSKNNYELNSTKVLIKVLKDSGGTVFFNGKGAGGTFKAGHDNHIHVSWLSSFVDTKPRRLKHVLLH